MDIVYAAFALIFIAMDATMKAVGDFRFGRGRHTAPARARHAVVYLPSRNPAATSHRQRQGGLTMPVYRPGMFEAAA